MDCACSTIGWERLSEDQQLHVTRSALRFALRTVAGQAEALAGEMDRGGLLDRGGADALRLLANALRVSTADEVAAMSAPAPNRQPADLTRMTVAGRA